MRAAGPRRTAALLTLGAAILLCTVHVAFSADETPPAPPAEARPEIQRISIEGNTLLPPEDLREFAVQYEGRALSAAGIQSMVGALQERYAAIGYPTTRVVVPAQEVTDGVLKLRVVEGRVGSVEVVNNVWFSDENYLPYLPTEGELLDVPDLKRDLHYLNLHPDRQGKAGLTAGEEPGTTNIKLYALEDNPFHLSLSYDNEGTPDTPRSRTDLTVQYDNLFGRSQVAVFRFGTAPGDNDKVRQYIGTYYVPLAPLGGPVGHSVTAYGAYSRSATETVLNAFSLSGQGTVLGTQYTMPLRRCGTFYQDLSFGAEYQEIKDDVGFGGGGTKNTVHTLPLIVRWSATGKHDDGVTNLSAGLRWQRDELFRNFDQANYEDSRAGADPDFVVCTVRAQRVQHLCDGWTGSLATVGQLSDERLLPSQQFGLGGWDSVRGYRSRVTTTDDAFNVRAEVRSPVLPPVLPEEADEQTQVLAFLDYGWGNNRENRPGEPDTENLIGAGVGLRVGLFDGRVTGRVDLAWALHDVRATPDGEEGDCIVHLGFGCRY